MLVLHWDNNANLYEQRWHKLTHNNYCQVQVLRSFIKCDYWIYTQRNN